MTFAEELKAIRKEKNLSRAYVCREIGVPYRTWENWEVDNGINAHAPAEWLQKIIIRELNEMEARK